MIPHIPPSGLTRRRGNVSLLPQLDQREPQVIGHPAVAELLGLPDARLVGVPRLVLAPEPAEDLAKAGVRVPLVLVPRDVALQHRRLVLVTLGLSVLVGQGQEPRRVVRVVRDHALEVLDPVLEALHLNHLPSAVEYVSIGYRRPSDAGRREL